MIGREMTLRQGINTIVVPNGEDDAPTILTSYAKQLNTRDRNQLISAFNNKSYEMASSYIWQKTLSLLKEKLESLGIVFLSEILNRPDIKENSLIEQKISDYEAIGLSEELGLIDRTGAFRLKETYEKIHHFGSLSEDESEIYQMTKEDCTSVIRACVNTVIGQQEIEAGLDFKTFRDSLEDVIFKNDSEEIKKLKLSPYFHKRTSIRVLLSLIKTRFGAQLENVLANAILIIPLLWSELLKPERWQIGRAYSELSADGKLVAVSGLRKILLEVKGFDYVPEDLRSNSYMQAANDILLAHDEWNNNFFKETSPTKLLLKMGSVIPFPALSVCMTSVLSVCLGNQYGVSFTAQPYAKEILDKISDDRWIYFLNDCLPSDERILFKLFIDSPVKKWCEIVKSYKLVSKAKDYVQNKNIIKLLKSSEKEQYNVVKSQAAKLMNELKGQK